MGSCASPVAKGCVGLRDHCLRAFWHMAVKKNIKNIGRSKISAVGSGTGKISEKIIPAMKQFGYPIEDCRFLAEPIDYIIFDGASKGKVDYITFMDIKTGKTAGLDKHQEKIRDAIKDNNVKSEMI